MPAAWHKLQSVLQVILHALRTLAPCAGQDNGRTASFIYAYQAFVEFAAWTSSISTNHSFAYHSSAPQGLERCCFGHMHRHIATWHVLPGLVQSLHTNR